MTCPMPSSIAEYLQKRSDILLKLGFRQNGISVLNMYLELLWKANEELNLISRKMTLEELIDNHVIDCLLPLKKFPTDVKTVADFGSGGGLPGVIYAIQFPQIKFRLFEKSAKKQEFLEKCKKTIASNISVEGEIPSYLVDIDMITARGFKPIDVILEMSRGAYQKNVKYFLLKARREKIEEEMLLAKKKFKTITAAFERLQSPVLDVERHLVKINFSE